jgi:cytochrome c553
MLNKTPSASRSGIFVAAALLTIVAAAPALAGDAAKGKEKSAICAACHGADGNSVAPDFPRLAGQYPDYLVVTLQHYKSGKRKNPIMAPMVANLSAEDIADLAAYFSSQTNGLHKKY